MKTDMAMNFEASAAVGAVTCSQGGVPINGGHIQYWMGQAREARVERDTAMTDGHDRIAELNAEITRLRAEKEDLLNAAEHFRAECDAAVLAERERCKKSVRNTICTMHWPPEDGDQLIDDLQAGIALFATDGGANG